ncbi:hypothetical protein BGW36DRAFT_370245 [Talaromyces proteolyticus]|uniref:Uncharacterized protein n=1 Tax=Talaromyces proteolyticus TaxID=1131652 RepID=A0AAD4L5H3_9EURO|nr:uncharacterized protein BGW36DRAFT_370245 [Talaromyces proteolyticus]KAH8703932.1 hypothetical protein BGW36DRAFT_370245 [Talaromyces proteolyticus]
MSVSSTCITHIGTYDASTRDIPALAFVEKYSDKIDSLEISGPFHDWYAPSCTFFNTNGTVYHGGDEIWTWMKSLFGPFSVVCHNVKVIRLVEAIPTESDPEKAAYWAIIETETSFSMKDQLLAGDPIIVPRLLMFLIGKSEVDGQGTDGLQILEAKVWWDTEVLGRELTTRKGKSSQEH